MAQNTDAMNAEQVADHYYVSDADASFAGRVGEVVETEDVDGETVLTLAFDGAREEQSYTLDYLDPLGEWAEVLSISSRVREFVASVRDAEQIGTPKVVKVGDTGAILSPEFENGRLSGRVFEVADRYGFEVAEVNFNEGTVLFQDSARTE